jgi:hypothetical protein
VTTLSNDGADAIDLAEKRPWEYCDCSGFIMEPPLVPEKLLNAFVPVGSNVAGFLLGTLLGLFVIVSATELWSSTAMDPRLDIDIPLW